MIDNYSRASEEEKTDYSAPDSGLSLPKVSTQADSTLDLSELEPFALRESGRSRSLKVRIALEVILWSVPVVAFAAILSVVFNQPFLALLLTSVAMAALAGAVADRLTRRNVTDRAKDEALELLEVENNRLSNQLQALARQQEKISKQRHLLSNIGFRVHQVPKLDLLFESVVQGTRDLLEADRVAIYRFNPDWTGTMVAESVVDGFPKVLHETIGDPCFRERYIKQYQNGLISRIDDVYQDPKVTDCYLRMLEQYRVRANLVAPIRQDEQLYGLLIAHQCSGPRVWTDADVNLVMQISTEMDFHLEYVRRTLQQDASARHAWFLGDIAFRARQTKDLDDILQATLKGVRQLLPADRVMFYRFNPDWSGTMVAESVDAQWPSVLHEKIDDPCFRGQYVELYRNGRVRAINDLRKEPGLTECHIRTLEKYGVKANLVAPLRHNNELVGLLIAHHCSSVRVWDSLEINFFSQVALQLEYAMEHLSYIEKIEAAADRSRLFGDIAFRARQSLDEANVLRVVAQGALKTLHTDRVLFYRFNPDWSGTMIVESVSSELWPKVLDAKIEDPCFRGRYVELYRNGRVRAINDIYQEPGLTDCHVRTLEQYAVKANLVAPIRRDGQLYGLLIAHHCAASRVWKKNEIDFFSELAIQTEYALDHLNFIANIESARHTAEHASQEQHQQTEIIKHQLEALRQDVQGAFNGDLTVRAMPPAGEIGIFATFLNATIENLQRIVLQVQSASEAVIHTARASEKNITTLSNEALRQATVIAGTLGEVQAMADSIQGVTANAQRAKLKVQQADLVLQEGDRAMNRTVGAISAIQAKVEETAQQVKLLGEASQNISRVVNLIRELASQTNVLALNASIEANSSGDRDQGFAVVAEEVRSIAERSTVATRQIEQIVEEIQTETNQVVTAMGAWREQVIAGTELVETTRQKLNSIATVSAEIRTLVEAMAQAAMEQSQASSSVSSTMQEVKTIAQQNSSQSVAVARSFTQLLEVAQQLQESVAQFKVQ
ncbi:GAF domain-containing protein [Altericista sp. CCNU0014]|uniref:GAF domain-containing protein n=1 Tax=Altericista sp. CCNU0014 TaxID=3082949 RepID=UPI0038502AAF